MPSPRTNRIILRTARAITLTGTPFPAETLTASRAAQWFVDDAAIVGQTGATYTVGVADIGRTIRCGRGEAVPIWHPRDVAAVKAAWVPFSGVYNSVGPDVAATDGQTLRSWVDCVGGYRAEQSTGLRQPVFDGDAFGTTPGIVFDGANTFLKAVDGTVGLIRNVGYSYLITSHRLGTSPTLNSYVAAFNRTGTAGTMLSSTARFLEGNGIVACRRTFAQSAVSVGLGSQTVGVVRVDTAQAEYQNNILRGRRDGAEVGTIAIGTSGNSEDQDCLEFSIGLFDTAGLGGANFFKGTIGAVIVVAGNSLISETDRNRLERFAGLCAGKSLSLPIS